MRLCPCNFLLKLWLNCLSSKYIEKPRPRNAACPSTVRRTVYYVEGSNDTYFLESALDFLFSFRGRRTAQFEHVVVTGGNRTTRDLASLSHGQIQSEVPISASEFRWSVPGHLRSRGDAPGTEPAAVPRRGGGRSDGPSNEPVRRQHRWTWEPHTCSRSDQSSGKRYSSRGQCTGCWTYSGGVLLLALKIYR